MALIELVIRKGPLEPKQLPSLAEVASNTALYAFRAARRLVDERLPKSAEWRWFHSVRSGRRGQIWEAYTKAPRFLKYAVMFAYGTGLRCQDQWNLKLIDLHMDAEQPCVTFKMSSKPLIRWLSAHDCSLMHYRAYADKRSNDRNT